MLPKVIDPRRSADQDIEYQCSMQAGVFPRLIDAVEELSGDVAVQVRVYRDEQSRMRIAGETSVNASMVCQRCLQSSLQELNAGIDLAIVYTEEQAKALPKGFDAWVVEESANLHELIEDELLLAMPIVAYHSDKECSAPDEYQRPDSDEKIERQSPFAVLRDLAGSSD